MFVVSEPGKNQSLNGEGIPFCHRKRRIVARFCQLYIPYIYNIDMIKYG
jgi:hypothetical protein